MKLLTTTLFLILTLHVQSTAQEIFELEPSQAMLMTGKGPGQDGSINPYAGEDCYAIVKNIGKLTFTIRIQQDGKILETIPVKKRETKKVKLLKDHELYLDSNEGGMIKAKLDYEEIKHE